jgi:hypothetical protein
MRKSFIAALLVFSSTALADKPEDLDGFEALRTVLETQIYRQADVAVGHQSAMRAAGLEPTFDASLESQMTLGNLQSAVEADQPVYDATGKAPQMSALAEQIRAIDDKSSVARIIDYGRIRNSCRQ